MSKKNILNNFSSSNNPSDSNSQAPQSEEAPSSNWAQKSNTSNQSNSSNGSNNTSSSIPDFDINTILKIKSVMDSLGNNKNDPRANLLLSLKPYLADSKKEKVDQYIKFLSLAKVIEVLNPLGGETKNE